MPDYFKSVHTEARFAADQFTKADLFAGQHLFVGLNCFEPGQTQRLHTHGGADKFYLILTGKASMTVGGDTREVGEGTLVWAPADLPHGVAQVSQRTIMLVALAPPPGSATRSQTR